MKLKKKLNIKIKLICRRVKLKNKIDLKKDQKI